MSNQPEDHLFSNGLITVKQACKEFSVSAAFLYAAMERGELGYVKLRRARRIPRQEMLEYVKANYKPGWKPRPGETGKE